MERVARFARYFRWMWRDDDDDDDEAATPASSPTAVPAVVPPRSSSAITTHNTVPATSPWRRSSHEAAENGDDACELWGFLESILLWEDVFCSLLVFLGFNVLFWNTIVLKFGGFATVGGTAVLMMFCCWAMVEPAPRQESEARDAERAVFYCRIGKLRQIGKRILHSLAWLRGEQPGLFCILACTASVCVWLFGYVVSGVMLMYTICTCILLGPAILLKVPDRMPHGNQRESDSEIEEFLPAATETNIQVLAQAGEAGEYSQTPTSALAPSSITNEEQEFLNDGDLAGHKMPSHEDGSSDGLELSDLELSDKSSTSSSSNLSDSEFEIIDQQEIGKLDTPRDPTL